MVRQAELHRSSASIVNMFEGVPAMTAERAPVEVLKVSAPSKPVAVAGAIAGVIRTQGRVEVQAIGDGAINQAVKAIAISRGYVAPGGLDIVCIPSFIDISTDGEARTGRRLLVAVRRAGLAASRCRRRAAS